MNLGSEYRSREASSEEQILYDHFLQLVENESPAQLIERFKFLFLDGVGYPEPQVTKALEVLLSNRFVSQEFDYILNRCFHILVNRWQLHDRNSLAIPELVYSFEKPPTNKGGSLYRSRNLSRLHQLITAFTKSEQYQTLYRLAQVIDQANDFTEVEGNRPLGTLIRRYPYLYNHCLLSEDSGIEHQQTIRKLKAAHQHQFECNLAQYVTYQVRRGQLAKRRSVAPGEINKIIQPVRNPTLLTNSELSQALKHYRGKVQKGHSYQT